MAKHDLLGVGVKLLEALTADLSHTLLLTQACAICDTDETQLVAAVDMLAELSDRASGTRVAVYVDDESIVLDGDAGWLRAVRLTPAEALVVGQVLETLDIDRNLALLIRRAALGDGATLAGTDTLLADTTSYGTYQQALTEAASYGIRCRMLYRGATDTKARERTIDPHRVERADGVAYLLAWDVDKDQERRFRLDRVEDVVYTEDSVAEHPWSGRGIAQSLRRSGSYATVSCSAAFAERAGWAGAEQVGHEGDLVTLEISYVSESWLFDQVLGSGGAARIIEPQSLKHRFVAYASALL